jgi:hypothetical protein
MDGKTESIIRANFETALLEFDFVRVHSVMEFLDWEWCGKDERHVPSIVEMIRSLEDLLKSAINFMDDGFSSVATGGFMIEIFDDNSVEISFVVTDSRGYSEASDNTVG